MLGVLADDHHATLALDDLALLADFLHRRSDFHKEYLPRAVRTVIWWGSGAPFTLYAK